MFLIFAVDRILGSLFASENLSLELWGHSGTQSLLGRFCCRCYHCCFRCFRLCSRCCQYCRYTIGSVEWPRGLTRRLAGIAQRRNAPWSLDRAPEDRAIAQT